MKTSHPTAGQPHLQGSASTHFAARPCTARCPCSAPAQGCEAGPVARGALRGRCTLRDGVGVGGGPSGEKQSPKKKKKKPNMSVGESFKYLAGSRYIRNLFVLVVAYGMSINMVEVTWKGKLKQAPQPSVPPPARPARAPKLTL